MPRATYIGFVYTLSRVVRVTKKDLVRGVDDRREVTLLCLASLPDKTARFFGDFNSAQKQSHKLKDFPPCSQGG